MRRQKLQKRDRTRRIRKFFLTREGRFKWKGNELSLGKGREFNKVLNWIPKEEDY